MAKARGTCKTQLKYDIKEYLSPRQSFQSTCDSFELVSGFIFMNNSYNSLSLYFIPQTKSEKEDFVFS